MSNFPVFLVECVGIVEAALRDTGIMVGQPVAALMGGMGRQYDGGYAEHVIPITNTSNLPWETRCNSRDLSYCLGIIS
jgi:hypothetical protein